MPLHAGVGDLLVAPTRIVLDGRSGTEIILNNIGDDVATYRISVEFRRMKQDGTLEDVTKPSAAEKAAEEMIVYAPRRVTLPPNQPQSIRIARARPKGLPDGEYRVHLLFRAIPAAKPVTAPAARPRASRFAADPDLRRHHPGHRPPRQSPGQGRHRQRPARSEDGKPAVALDLPRRRRARPSARSAC